MMNKRTSNDMMNDEFDKLNQLPQREPPAHLYGKILSKIEAENYSSSSDDLLESEFEKLQNIANLVPPAGLYEKIKTQIERPKKLTISTKWLSAAAAVFAVIVCMEVFLVIKSSNQSNSNDIEVLVQNDTYQLYE